MALLFAASAFLEDRTAVSLWTTSPIKVDGQDDEWPASRLYSEKKPGVRYAFQNDARSPASNRLFSAPQKRTAQ